MRSADVFPCRTVVALPQLIVRTISGCMSKSSSERMYSSDASNVSDAEVGVVDKVEIQKAK